MPFNELHRRDSFPPTIVRIYEDEPNTADAMDENPFAFFLTAPDEVDDDLEDLSAGIETSEKTNARFRAVSPSALDRVPYNDSAIVDEEEDEDESPFGIYIPVSLKDYTYAHQEGRRSRSSQRPEDLLEDLGILKPIELMSQRGRAQVMAPRTWRGRGHTRSLPARKPHVWREPSPDVWSIEEEDESEDENLAQHDSLQHDDVGNVKDSEAKFSTSKFKKRVHWAM